MIGPFAGRALRRVALALPAVALIGLAVAPPALADDAGAADPAPTKLSVTFNRSSGPGVPNYLVAKLTLENGSAIAGEEVAFIRRAELGGTVLVEMGRVETDPGGYARLPIVPREDRYEVTVEYDGSAAFGATEVTADVAFPAETVERPQHAPNGGAIDPRLRPLANLMPGVLAGAVVIVWLVLILVSVLTLRAVVVAGRGQSRIPGERHT